MNKLTLEEVEHRTSVQRSSINVTWNARPAFRNEFWVSWMQACVSVNPILSTLEKINSA
jgi:hypothetical protein